MGERLGGPGPQEIRKLSARDQAMRGRPAVNSEIRIIPPSEPNTGLQDSPHDIYLRESHLKGVAKDIFAARGIDYDSWNDITKRFDTVSDVARRVAKTQPGRLTEQDLDAIRKAGGDV